MKVKLKTTILKEMTARAIKGVGNNKLLPLTELLCMKIKDNQLVMVTSDGTNYLYIKQSITDNIDKDFYAVVKADSFGKLISKLTCENVELVISSNSLEIRAGKGVYRLELFMDEDGEVVVYPDPISEVEMPSNPHEVSIFKIHEANNICKASLAQTLEVPCYTGFYCSDKVIATDGSKIAVMNNNLFSENILVSPEMFNLLDLITTERADFYLTDTDIMVFSTPDCDILGRTMEGVGEYPVTPILKLLNIDMKGHCTVRKSELLSMLERILLFVTPYDDSTVRFTFAKDGLNIESMQSSGVEIIPYLSNDRYIPFTALIDITFLMDEIKSIKDDVVDIKYGADNAIAIDASNVVIIIALIEDNSNGEK